MRVGAESGVSTMFRITYPFLGSLRDSADAWVPAAAALCGPEGPELARRWSERWPAWANSSRYPGWECVGRGGCAALTAGPHPEGRRRRWPGATDCAGWLPGVRGLAGSACGPQGPRLSAPSPCNGLTHEAHRKEVEQVYLRCSAGSVEWLYPTGALIVNLRPNSAPSRHLTVCIKPFRDSSGANIYLEKTGELRLLVRDGDLGPSRVQCFGLERGGLFVEATPQQDIRRRTPCRPCSDTEVLLAVCTSDFVVRGSIQDVTHEPEQQESAIQLPPCRPCSDTEVLLAVCTSDFVVRGSIQDVTHEPEQQESAIQLRVSRVYRQKSRVFQPGPRGGHWQGHVTTLLECGVRPGRGDFLFTGHMHFGEARLGCAPRFQDFQRVYRDAEERGLNPCEIGAEMSFVSGPQAVPEDEDAAGLPLCSRGHSGLAIAPDHSSDALQLLAALLPYCSSGLCLLPGLKSSNPAGPVSTSRPACGLHNFSPEDGAPSVTKTPSVQTPVQDLGGLEPVGQRRDTAIPPWSWQVHVVQLRHEEESSTDGNACGGPSALARAPTEPYHLEVSSLLPLGRGRVQCEVMSVLKRLPGYPAARLLEAHASALYDSRKSVSTAATPTGTGWTQELSLEALELWAPHTMADLGGSHGEELQKAHM
ncbi:Meteorin-like protein [Tupaia chinensis]|uniref:Meteorin-like protein n=1 Tax=Tupaia chinensis TaxID=246437 RepID=L9KHZ6_TUPCH|nr:Meteorin-like protein [Tupaia chinensis]